MGDRINVTFRKYSLQKDEIKEVNCENMRDVCDIDDIKVAPVLRAVSYICMSPKIKVRSKDIIRQRIAAFETMSTCSHWPHKCQILYKPKNMKNKNVSEVKDELIKSLIGVDLLSDKRYQNIPENVAQSKGKQKKSNKSKRWQRR